MKKQRTMAGSAVVLAVCSLFAKVLSAFYRIPLTNILGAEGMGMYQLIFSIYALILALTTGGIPLAVSRIVAERNASGNDTKGVLKAALLSVTAASVLIAVLLIFTGKYIALLQGNGAVGFGYALVAPSVIFVGALAMFRGWFQGNCNVVPTAVSQIIEQLFKLVFGLVFANMLLPRGVIYAVYGALLGVAISEFAAFIYAVITYLFVRKKLPDITPKEGLKATTKSVLKISMMFAIAGFIVPLSQFIDGILIINLLKYTGLDTAAATSQYGIFSGTVTSVVNMPVVLILSLSVALVPYVSMSRINRNLENIILKSATSIKLSYAVGIPAAALLFIFANPIMNLLYPKLNAVDIALSVKLLKIACFTTIFAAQREIYGSLLMALNYTGAVIKNNIAAVLLKTAALALMLLTIGIEGAAWASLILGATATFLNINMFNKILGKNLKLVKNVSTIILSGAIMSLAAYAVSAVTDGVVSIIVGGIAAVVIYFLCLMLFRVFDSGELSGIPLSRYFDKMTAKIRFWEKEK